MAADHFNFQLQQLAVFLRLFTEFLFQFGNPLLVGTKAFKHWCLHGFEAAGEFGKTARVPVIWLVAANDSYFSPDLSRQLVDAFRGGGARVEFRVLPASGSEGHWLVETEAGVKSAGPELNRALKLFAPTEARKR